MKFSRTLTLAMGSAVIVLIVVTYFFQGPPWPALLGALGAIVWIVIKAWRERRAGPSTSGQTKTKDEAASSDHR